MYVSPVSSALPKEYNNKANYDETNSLVSLDEILSLLIRRRVPIIFSFVVFSFSIFHLKKHFKNIS